jgi:hypothetical protein
MLDCGGNRKTMCVEIQADGSGAQSSDTIRSAWCVAVVVQSRGARMDVPPWFLFSSPLDAGYSGNGAEASIRVRGRSLCLREFRY